MKNVVIYSYTMTSDSGFAPCYDNGKFTLACCKSHMRYRLAKEYSVKDDETDYYVIGLIGKKLIKQNGLSCSLDNKPIYIAKIADVLKTSDYFSESSITEETRFDKKYLYEKDKWYVLPGNCHHKSVNKKTQIVHNKDFMYKCKGIVDINFVIRSDVFIHYGKDANDEILKPLSGDTYKKLTSVRRTKWGNRVVIDGVEALEFTQMFDDANKVNNNPINMVNDCKSVCEAKCDGCNW